MKMLLPTLFFVADILLSAPASSHEVEACVAPVGQRPDIANISVIEVPSEEIGLRALRVTAPRGAYLFIYFDERSEAAARSRAACLGAQLPLLQDQLDDRRENAEWASVVFTQNANYVPPRSKGTKTRWIVNTDPVSRLSSLAERMVISVIPHEQVHDYQTRAGARMPRWFAEGHAKWVGTKVTEQLNQGAADANRATAAVDLATSDAALDLKTWGSVRPRREAILRQVSEEDRARMETDPTFTPSGTFKFTSDDLIGDESNMQARYAAAWNVFSGLESRHGAAAVRRWVAEVTSTPGMLSDAKLAASILEHFDESMDDLLTKAGTPSLALGEAG